MLRGKTLSSLWGPFLGPAIERRSRLGTDKEKGQGFPSACHRLRVTSGLFLLPLVRPIEKSFPLPQSQLSTLDYLVDSHGWGRGGKSKRPSTATCPRNTPRAKRNRKFFILTGLFLSSNIFIQIPVKTTSDTGYATMV